MGNTLAMGFYTRRTRTVHKNVTVVLHAPLRVRVNRACSGCGLNPETDMTSVPTGRQRRTGFR